MKKNNSRVVIIISIILLICSQATLKSSIWEPRDAPHGGQITDIVKYKNKLYATCYNCNQIYESNIDGNEWVGFEYDFGTGMIDHLASDENFFYVLDGAFVTRTTLQDNDWKIIFDDIENYYQPILLQAFDSGLYLFTKQVFEGTSKLYRSTDNGEDWVEISLPSEIKTINHFTVINNSIYVITDYTLLYSNNLGNTWEKPIDFPNATLNKVYEINNKVYINLKSTTDDSYQTVYFIPETKEMINNSIPSFADYSLLNKKQTGDNIVISMYKYAKPSDYYYFRVAYSKDDGKNWQVIYDTTMRHIIYFNEGLDQSDDAVFIGTENIAILKIDLATNTTSHKVNTIYNHTNFSTVSGATFGTLYTDDKLFLFTSQNNGIYKSVNYARDWTQIENSPISKYYSYPWINRIIKHKDLFAAATDDGVFISNEDATEWKLISANLIINDIYSDGTTLYALGLVNMGGAYNGQYMYSKDNGKSWSNHSLPGYYTAGFFVIDGDTVCLHSLDGILRSTDNGENWTKVMNPMTNPLMLRPMIKAGENFVTAVTNHILISTNKGASWTNPTTEPEVDLLIDFAAKDNILFTTSWQGVYLSLDYGIHWEEINDGLPHYQGTYSQTMNYISILNDSVYVSATGRQIYKAHIADFSNIRIDNMHGQVMCNNMTFELPYTINKDIQFGEDNKFIAQLSDTNGSFYYGGTEIGTVNSQSDGSINVTIPEFAKYSSKYRIRVVSTVPKITGIDNLSDLTILENTPPIITGDIEVCNGREYAYSVNTSKGFDYFWEIEGGTIIGNPKSSNINAVWGSDLTGKLKVIQTSQAECSDTTYITTNIHLLPAKPIITREDKTLISSNDYRNQWYLNDNPLLNDTNKILIITEEGNYTVKTRNLLGCGSEFSDVYHYINEDNLLVFTIDTVSAKSGENISLNIRLAKNKEFYNTKAENFELTLVFNSTILYPNDIEKGGVVDNKRFLTVKFDTNYITKDIVHIVNLQAMLGEVESTEITISSLKVNGKLFDKEKYIVNNGLFSLNDICYEGGARLITSNKNIGIVSVSPNPTSDNIDIEVKNTNQNSKINLYIQDILGKKVKNIFNNMLQIGKFHYFVPLSDMQVGEYYIIMESDTEREIKKFIILR